MAELIAEELTPSIRENRKCQRQHGTAEISERDR